MTQDILKLYKPKLSEAYNKVGWDLLKEGNSQEPSKRDFEKAKSAFARAVVLNPENMQAFHSLGICNFRYAKTLEKPEQRAMFEQAREAYEKAHELQPDHPMLNADLGSCYIRLKEYNKAIEHLKKAQELGVDSELVNNDLSLALAQQRETDQEGEPSIEDMLIGVVKETREESKEGEQ